MGNNNESLEKKKALEAALGQIEKQFGKGSIMKLGEYKEMNVEAYISYIVANSMYR